MWTWATKISSYLNFLSENKFKTYPVGLLWDLSEIVHVNHSQPWQFESPQISVITVGTTPCSVHPMKEMLLRPRKAICLLGPSWLPCWLCGKDSALNAVDAGVLGSIPGWENPLEKEMTTDSRILPRKTPMDRGIWCAIVHGVARVQQDWLSTLSSFLEHELDLREGRCTWRPERPQLDLFHTELCSGFWPPRWHFQPEYRELRHNWGRLSNRGGGVWGVPGEEMSAENCSSLMKTMN